MGKRSHFFCSSPEAHRRCRRPFRRCRSFAPAAVALRSSSKLALSKAVPQMSMDLTSVEQMSTTLAGVVAVDGGTTGLEVTFGAFLAVILGLFIPVVFLVTLFIQSEAQGTATTFRQPDSVGGQ